MQFIWNKPENQVLTQLSYDLDDFLVKLHDKHASLGEIRRLKQFHDQDALDSMARQIQKHLKNDWAVELYSAYVDHYPRVKNCASITKPNGIEIADLLLVKSIFADKKTDPLRTALLVQAKAYKPEQDIAIPDSTDRADNDGAQRFFLNELSAFELFKKDGSHLGKFNPTRGLDTTSVKSRWQHSRYLLVARETSNNKTPDGYLHDARWWAGMPEIGSPIVPFSTTFTTFVMGGSEHYLPTNDDIGTGRGFDTPDPAEPESWDNLVATILDFVGSRTLSNLVGDTIGGLLEARGFSIGVGSKVPDTAWLVKNTAFLESLSYPFSSGHALSGSLKTFANLLTTWAKVNRVGSHALENPGGSGQAPEETDGADEGMVVVHVVFRNRDAYPKEDKSKI